MGARGRGPRHPRPADLSLRPDISVRADTPPTFLLQAEDDHVDGVEQSLAYYVALQKAGVPTEMHLYAQGGHAFGLRPTKLPIALAAVGGDMVADHWNGGGAPRTLTVHGHGIARHRLETARER